MCKRTRFRYTKHLCIRYCIHIAPRATTHQYVVVCNAVLHRVYVLSEIFDLTFFFFYNLNARVVFYSGSGHVRCRRSYHSFGYASARVSDATTTTITDKYPNKYNSCVRKYARVERALTVIFSRNFFTENTHAQYE